MVRWTPAPTLESDLAVREITSQAELVDFERTLIECYPVKELLPFSPGRFTSSATLETAWRLFVGYVDGEPITCAAAYPTAPTTLVEMVATRTEHRGRGYGAVITATAADSNCDVPAVLIASDDGQGVYERLGFRRISRFTLWLGNRQYG
jgi:predicted GNAT family acetyltransferase